MTEDTDSIFEAIQKERLGNVERLIAQGALLEERNSEGLTPLLYAIQRLKEYQSYKGNVEKIILTLLEKGAFLESTDAQGNTPLLKCCLDFNHPYLPTLARFLLERGADLEARNQQGATPLFMAAMNGKVDVLKVLIEKNADIEARNNAHQTPLMIAAEKNQIKIVDELLLAGAFVDSRDQEGMTPLMYASYRGHLAVMQILLQHNADISLTSTKDVVLVSKKDQYVLFPYSNLYTNRTLIPAGSTALTFAEKYGGRGAEKVLLEAWVKIDPTMKEFLIQWRKKVAEF